jgi:crotonobetainyl-CoA:carnitine CoA-transferase CaiB-like acyl-CoA transferase
VPCSDGGVSITLTNQDDLADLGRMIGADVAAMNDSDRVKQCLTIWGRNLTRSEIVDVGQTWRLPLLPVRTRSEACQGEILNPFQVKASCSAQPTPRRRLPAAPEKPLAGIRVLDLGMVWAGPYCGRLLAGLGAEIIKIEGPQRRDGTRPPDDWHGCSGLFGDLNRGKSSLVLDLSKPTGRDVFLELTREADVVLENFSSRVMPNFGLDYAALSAVNPALIQLSMPAFESDGPFAQYVAYGSGMELAVGLGIRTAEGLTPAPVPYLDLLTGVYGAIAVIAGLFIRDHTLDGSHLEVAQHSVGRHLVMWCQGESWGEFKPSVDPAAIVREPRLKSSDLFSEMESGQYCHHFARCPWSFEGPGMSERDAPVFGEDSVAILKDLGGLTAPQIENLLNEGVAMDWARSAEFIPPSYGDAPAPSASLDDGGMHSALRTVAH